MNTADLPALIAMLRAAEAPGGADLGTLIRASGKSRATVFRYLDDARAHFGVEVLSCPVGPAPAAGSAPNHWYLIDWGCLDPERVPSTTCC